jgi:hypothetical protein
MKLLLQSKTFFDDLNFSTSCGRGRSIHSSIAAEDIETFEDSKKVADYKYSLESFLQILFG